MILQTKKEEFLSNKENKQRFIALLSQKLEQSGCEVHQARADADLLIVQTAVATAASRVTVLVGDDTDLLVLLIHHAHDVNFEVFFRPEPKRHVKKAPRCWNISSLREMIGEAISKNILFLHAILGCDTTSAIFGMGKKAAIAR